MSSHEDEEGDGPLQNPAFSAHLQKFGYTPPAKDHNPARPQASKYGSAQRIDKVIAKTGNKNHLVKSSERNKRKRHVDGDFPAPSPSPAPSKRRTSTKERSANDAYDPENKLVDSLRPGLMLVFIGLNPGLETARTGMTNSITE